MITAPFNFVPLSEKVFFPDWSGEVSHDVPFEDAQSGVIDITMTAKSPIFVRDGENGEVFCNHNGTQYIPGSSVKGMIRSVLEIMSFSKMSQINDDTYAVRDLSDSNNFYMKEMKKDTFCGWLRKDGKDFIVEDCGKPGRIKHEELDKIFEMDFASQHKKGKFGNKAADKTALRKYGLIKSDNFRYPFVHTTTSTIGEKRYGLDKTSSLFGTIVLTGQPSGRDEDRKIPSGKVYEFVFFEKKSDIKLREEVVANFMFAYFDGRKTEPKESPDWKYWKEKLDNGEKVPVFFQKNGKDIAHFGLSYLYKLPYKHSVKDGLPPMHTDERKDMAETMFGYIGKDEALKGRVQFSHFKATNNVKVLSKTTAVLGTPRASYYPMYVKQEEGKLFKTFMDGDFSISGWKRYPVHAGASVEKSAETENENIGTTFTPLKDGVVFSGKLRYHNLKKAELGALLSSLTFHGTQGCFHNIGLAKALGYGKINLELSTVDNMQDCLKAFEVELSEQVENWADTPQLRELLSMASEQNNSGNSKLKYMDLPAFAKNKTGTKDYLRNYTLLDNIQTISAKSLVTQEDLDALRVRQEERKEQEKLRQEKRKKEAEHEAEWKIVYDSTTLSTIEAFIHKYPETSFLKTANEMIVNIKDAADKVEKDLYDLKVKEKFDAAMNAADKYKEKALNEFVEKFEDSKFVVEARSILATFNIVGESVKVNIDDLASAKDAKRLKSILESLKLDMSKITATDKEKIKVHIVNLYNSLKGKKQKNFFKEAQLARLIGADFEDEVKDVI